MEPLSDLELNVLAGFFPRPKCCLMKYIMKRCRYSVEEVYPTLIELEKRGIIEKTWIGNVVTYSINLEREEAISGYTLYTRIRKSELLIMYPEFAQTISNIVEKVNTDCVVAYGPHTKFSATPDTPLNILFICKDKQDKKIDLDINLQKITTTTLSFIEFKILRTEDQYKYDEIVDFGIVFKGLKIFFELIYGNVE